MKQGFGRRAELNVMALDFGNLGVSPEREASVREGGLGGTHSPSSSRSTHGSRFPHST